MYFSGKQAWDVCLLPGVKDTRTTHTRSTQDTEVVKHYCFA